MTHRVKKNYAASPALIIGLHRGFPKTRSPLKVLLLLLLLLLRFHSSYIVIYYSIRTQAGAILGLPTQHPLWHALDAFL